MVESKNESTDLMLFVRTSSHEEVKWDRQKIADALMRETSISEELAKIISIEVENMIKNSEIRHITAPLIRELANAKLIEYGFEDIRKQHARLGFPIYDVGNIITAHNKENANVPHGPEATNMTLAEGIKKEYALLKVFSPDVAEQHISGYIHLHDLGMVDRPYCGGQSIEYVKKFGLNLPNSLSSARPANKPEVLAEHIVKFSAALQGHFAGAIGWDAVNVFMAPYLTGVNKKRMKQIAQIILYEFAQQAVARGGQSIFSDLNIYWETPKHFEKVPALGPKGKPTGNTYGDYIVESQRLAKAIFEEYYLGDAAGRPFFFPKSEVHMTDKFFKTEGHEDFLNLISDVSAEKGNTYYVFDRGNTAKISECCRLSFKLEDSDLNDALTPWKMRYSAIQNVTVNLPKLAYEADRDDNRLFELLREKINIAVKAHIQKKKFIQSLLDLGNRGPLSLLAMTLDGEPYYRMYRASFLIGMLGLNELVQYHTGEEMHQSVKALKFGLKVIAFMNKECEEHGKQHDMHFVLEQTPAESTAYRMAKLDLKQYPIQASQVVKGKVGSNEVYYTNSTYLNVGAQINPIQRVKSEGLFHPLVEAGALTHVWLGESRPSSESIANFVKKTFKQTKNDQIAFSPEFTSCNTCKKLYRGLYEVCPHCGNSKNPNIGVVETHKENLNWNNNLLNLTKIYVKSQGE